jgi:hypothetical protein
MLGSYGPDPTKVCALPTEATHARTHTLDREFESRGGWEETQPPRMQRRVTLYTLAHHVDPHGA